MNANMLIQIKLSDLLELEWSAEGSGKCPVCGDVPPYNTDAPSTIYHSADCWLGNAIKKAQRNK